MKQKEVLNKIGGILKELSDQYEYLQTADDELNDLEVELFTANAHFLSDHIEIFRKLNLQNNKAKQALEKQQPQREEKYFEPVVQQAELPVTEQEIPEESLKPVEIETIIQNNREEEQLVPHIDLSSGTSEDTYSYIREEPETIRHELILDDNVNWDDEDEDVPTREELPAIHEEEPEVVKEPEVEIPHIEEVRIDVPTVEVEKEPAAEPEPVMEEQPVVWEPLEKETVVFELPTVEEVRPAPFIPETKAEEKPKEEEILTINQRISNQLADKTPKTEQAKPISDIKQAITLNDKLLFVKDLFNGYSLAYSEAIEILNRFKTLEEATHFLNSNYVVKNKWESKPETTEKFYSLLKRRYA